MPAANIPPREARRIEVLRDLAILDTQPEPAIDQITSQLVEMLEVPIALVSIVDEDRQWFKSCIGLDALETSRKSSFCAYTILSDEPLIIEDASTDPRTHDNDLVTGAPHIRAYLGYPLSVRGENIGSLCIIDLKPRAFSQGERALVSLAAKWVEREIDQRDRAALEEERNRAAQRARELFHHAPLPLIALNSDGSVGVLNQAAERLWESIGEGLLRDHLALGRIGESPIEAILDEVKRVGYLSSLDPIRLETPDGGAFYLQPTIVADPNSATGLLLGFVDQTELVLASRAWTEASDRERSVRTETIVEERQFMARLAHEMRNAVNGMMGLAELWKRERSTPTSEQMESMESCVMTLKGLVDDTLDYDLLKRGGFSLERQPFDLVRVCKELALSTQHEAEKKGLLFEAKVNLETSHYVGDELRIRQILINILSNSVKYTWNGTIDFHVRGEDDSVTFLVTDTGQGMSKEFQETVFDPYIQAKTNPSSSSEGVGLGLAIVSELVRHMNGTMTLQSAPGEGTCFEVRLPLPSTTVKPASSNPTNEFPHLDLDILIVDDNAVNRTVISAQLKHLGCQVAVAPDGLEALRYLAKHRPQVVLLDCHMPHLDGFETARRICSEPELYGAPTLIALTASVDAKAEEKCRDAGMLVFLQKPLGFVDLYHRLKDFSA